MIPSLTDSGRSFKGAAAYYLHDKRQAGEAARSSADRVAWTETLNLGTDDPERAWRMMAHTAIAQAELKAAAGVKATGRKLTKPVMAYSLSWHPDEKPTRADQMNAARETLRAMGLDSHQALIVSHNDEPHPHVHILVNRVNPETGVAATLNYSKLKLSEWALAYEQAQGKILCPEREKNNARRREGQAVKAARKPRAAFEAERAIGNDNLAGEFLKTEQRQKDAALYETGRQVRTAHGRQWAQLKSTYATLKGRIRESGRQLKTRKAADIKLARKGAWRDLFQKQRKERARFNAAEGSLLSRLANTATVYRMFRRHDPKARKP